MKAAQEGRLDIGPGTHISDSAISLAEELAMLCKQVKAQEKELQRLGLV